MRARLFILAPLALATLLLLATILEAPQQTNALSSTPTEISRGATNKKQVIFTFDAGSGRNSISEILAVLEEHGYTSTFFLTGKWAQAYPASTRSIVNHGHEIFNHTYSHPDLTALSDRLIVSQLNKAQSAIKSITGVSTKPYFRPPYGARDQNVLDAAWSAGYRSVFWSVDALDWKPGITAHDVKLRILSNVSPGAIYLMHVGDTITGDVLDEVLTRIEGKNYTVVQLSEGI